MPTAPLSLTPVSDRVPVHLQQAIAYCRTHAGDRVLFVLPRKQLAVAVRDGLYREGEGTSGVTCRVLRQLAQQYTTLHPALRGRTEIAADVAAVWLRGTLDRLPSSLTDPLRVGESVRHLAVPIQKTLSTLRENGVSVEAMRDLAHRDDAGADRAAIAECYARYVEFLDMQNHYDNADLLRWAVESIEAGHVPDLATTAVAVYDALVPNEEEARLLHALQTHAKDFVRIGGPALGLTPPDTSVAVRFQDVRVPATGMSGAANGPAGLNPAELTFQSAVGSANEVRQVMRTILENEIPLDEVEIAFPEGERYRSLLAGAAERLALPASLSTGYAANATRPGQALDGFYEWIQTGYDAAILIHLLRAGLIHLGPLQDRINEARETATDDDGEPAPRPALPMLSTAQAATLLAQRRYTSGENRGARDGYDSALTSWVKQIQNNIQDLTPDEDDRDAPEIVASLKRRKGRVEMLKAIVDQLLEWAEHRNSVKAVAAMSLRFLEIMEPTIRDREVDEVDRTTDEAALLILEKRLNRLKEADAEAAPAPDALQMVRQVVFEEFVQGLRPLPGRLHLVPLASAGYTGRRHLFVVGMDAESLSTSVTENALLLDEEREALRAETGIAIPRMQDVPDQESWEAVQALWRHAGPTTLLARSYDVENAEDVFPSSLYLRMEQAAHHAATSNGTSTPTQADDAGMRPPTSATVPLSDRDVWLATPAHALTTSGPVQAASEAAHAHYPWTIRGQEAEAARASDVYTAYDGLLTLREGDADALRITTATASRLETLAKAPYVYFLKYVLGVRSLDEPALDDTAWLDIRQKGEVLHDTFQAYMIALQKADKTPQLADEEGLLRETFDQQLAKKKAELSPPSEHIEEAVRSELWEDARVFLKAEIAHAAEGYVPTRFEYGFGFPEHRAQDDDAPTPPYFDLPDGSSLKIRGRIDRVDVRDGRTYLWDYKTGSQKHFDPTDPLQAGATLQWALYAAAYDRLHGDGSVAASGYFFTSVREMGARLDFDPAAVAGTFPALVQRLVEMASDGAFPMNPRLHDAQPWSYGDYDRIVPDRRTRSKTLQDKAYPDERVGPPFMEE